MKHQADPSRSLPRRLVAGSRVFSKTIATFGLLGGQLGLFDPKDQPMEIVRQIRDDIKKRVTALVNSRGWSGHSGGNS